MPKNESIEAKIKETATKLFFEKGYEGTTIRDIVKEADTNVALLNYYFRSKEKLFNSILTENLIKLSAPVAQIVKSDADLEGKIDQFLDVYTEYLLENPHFPVFLLSELQKKPQNFLDLLPENNIFKSLAEIFQANIDESGKKLNEQDVLNLVTNLLAMTLMPIISKNLYLSFYKMDEENFMEFVRDRKPLIKKMIIDIYNGMIKNEEEKN